MTIDELKALLGQSSTNPVEITETVEVGDLDHLDLDGRALQSSADPAFRIDGYQWSIRNGQVVATAGAVIDIVSSGQGLVSAMRLQSWFDDVVRCLGDSSCYDTLFQVCQIIGGPNIMKPLVNISLNNPQYNSNSWQNIRFQTKGNSGAPSAPCVLLECLNTTNWLYGNSFRDINAEMPNAGFIRCGATYGTIIDNLTVYDAHIAGPITEDILWFGKASVPGLDCSNTTVRNYTRNSGELNEDRYDLNFANHYSKGIMLEQISGTGSILRVKCDISATRIEVQDFINTWFNTTPEDL